jgi:hypothetical protein
MEEEWKVKTAHLGLGLGVYLLDKTYQECTITLLNFA